LSDGREVKAKPLGVFRTNNCGLLKIVEDGPWPSLDLAKDAYLPHESQSIAIAYLLKYRKGQKPRVFFVASAPGARNAPGTIWSLSGATDQTAGGPLIEDTGRLVGLYSGYNRYGGYVYTTVDAIEANLQRMMDGEVWGEWPEEAGPDVGADITSHARGCRIMGIRPETQLAAAGLQPGDFVENMDGQFLPHPDYFFRHVGRKDPGDKVEIEFRQGEEKRSCLSICATGSLSGRACVFSPSPSPPKACRPRSFPKANVIAGKLSGERGLGIDCGLMMGTRRSRSAW